MRLVTVCALPGGRVWVVLTVGEGCHVGIQLDGGGGAC